MANVTWLPRSGDSTSVLAFDTGPGVALLDGAATQATGGRQNRDDEGALAREGDVVESVLEGILANPFFRQPPPRSTGRELFGEGMLKGVVAEVETALGERLVPGSAREGWPHVLATLTALTARSIGEAYRKWVVPRGLEEVFLMGGGSRNPVLFQAIADELYPVAVLPGEALGMDPDAREAAAFALLAWAHVSGLPANVPEATGSEGLRILGSWTPGSGGGRR
jgi:anhydro-N-acetylmuramic acid kinase